MRGDEVLVRPPETHMRLADLLTLLRAPTSETFYLEYNALHQYLGGAMRSKVPLPPQAAQLRPLLTNLWLGKGATVSPLHYDEYENLLAQVRGTKELLLFPPADHRNLYYTARAKGTLRYRWPDTWERKAIEGDAREAKVNLPPREPGGRAPAEDDCLQCRFCLDKKRNGGPAILKKPCILKQGNGAVVAPPPAAAASSSSSGNART